MLRRLAALVAGLALLAACQGKPEVVEPDTTDSATASPAPTMPAQAREDSQEGATAFVAYWVEVFNHAVRTGDLDTFNELSSECDACNSYAETIVKDAEAGNLPDGDLWSFRDALVNESPEGGWDVAARIEAVTEEGDEVYKLGFVLEENDGGFVVTHLYIAEGV